MSLLMKYGKTALIAGASESIGAAFARHLAMCWLDLLIVARRAEPLMSLAKEIEEKYKVSVQIVSCDLSKVDAAETLLHALDHYDIDFLYIMLAYSI